MPLQTMPSQNVVAPGEECTFYDMDTDRCVCRSDLIESFIWRPPASASNPQPPPCESPSLCRPSDLLIGENVGHNFKHIDTDFTPLQQRVMSKILLAKKKRAKVEQVRGKLQVSHAAQWPFPTL